MTGPTAPDPLEALRARAERGMPAGADAVLAAARRAASDDTGSDAPEPVDARRSRRWLGTAAAVAIVAAGGAGAVLIARDHPSSTAASGGPFCAALEASALPPYDLDGDLDVVVYLEPGASAAEVAEVRDGLRADRQVEAVRYIDVDQTYQRFRDLFRSDDTLLENVRPTDLPTSFETTVAPGAEPGEVAARWRSDPSVWEVRDRDAQGLRVLDALVWAGTDPRVVSDDFLGSMSADVRAGWDERVQEARITASPYVSSAISELASVLSDRRRPLDPGDPEAQQMAAYAERLTTAARTDCGLTPRPATARSSAAPSSSPTTTSPPVPPDDRTTAPTSSTTTASTTTTGPAPTTSTSAGATTTTSSTTDTSTTAAAAGG